MHQNRDRFKRKSVSTLNDPSNNNKLDTLPCDKVISTNELEGSRGCQAKFICVDKENKEDKVYSRVVKRAVTYCGYEWYSPEDLPWCDSKLHSRKIGEAIVIRASNEPLPLGYYGAEIRGYEGETSMTLS